MGAMVPAFSFIFPTIKRDLFLYPWFERHGFHSAPCVYAGAGANERGQGPTICCWFRPELGALSLRPGIRNYSDLFNPVRRELVPEARVRYRLRLLVVAQ